MADSPKPQDAAKKQALLRRLSDSDASWIAHETPKAPPKEQPKAK